MCNKDTATMTPNPHKQRRTNKPLMEKKRRERINKCLNELKTVVLKAQKKDLSRFTKLEKADILEMTLRHLRSLHNEGDTPSNVLQRVPDPVKYQSGFSRCVSEVSAFVQGKRTMAEPGFGDRLIAHLNNILPHISPPTREGTTVTAKVSKPGESLPGECCGRTSTVQDSEESFMQRFPGTLTVSHTVCKPTSSDTVMQQGLIIDKNHTPDPGGRVGREKSPPWSPPSPPLTDSVQVRLSFHKNESPFSRGSNSPTQLVVQPISLRVSQVPEIGDPQVRVLPHYNIFPQAPPECQDVPLNLAPLRNGHPTGDTNPHSLYSKVTPSFQGNDEPLSPPSSLSSTPEPPYAQYICPSTSTGAHNGNVKSSPGPDQSQAHWRPW